MMILYSPQQILESVMFGNSRADQVLLWLCVQGSHPGCGRHMRCRPVPATFHTSLLPMLPSMHSLSYLCDTKLLKQDD